jgi:hypothetical protein
MESDRERLDRIFDALRECSGTDVLGFFINYHGVLLMSEEFIKYLEEVLFPKEPSNE